jgi:4-hydroxythreonine-4-phosphate dehydrogenase
VSPDRADRQLPTIAVTSGEPAGVGPELCAALLAEHGESRLLLIGDRDLLARAAGRALPEASILHVPLAAPVVPGRLLARRTSERK